MKKFNPEHHLAFLDQHWWVLNNQITASFTDFVATIKKPNLKWEARISRGSGYPESLPFETDNLAEAMEWIQGYKDVHPWNMVEAKLQQEKLLSLEQIVYMNSQSDTIL